MSLVGFFFQRITFPVNGGNVGKVLVSRIIDKDARVGHLLIVYRNHHAQGEYSDNNAFNGLFGVVAVGADESPVIDEHSETLIPCAKNGINSGGDR